MTNWKTSLIGLLLGVANLWAEGRAPKEIAKSSLMLALGLVTKDFNTHSTKAEVSKATDEKQLASLPK
jgi:hypothetical protein